MEFKIGDKIKVIPYESKFIICIDVRQAWGILSENLQEI